MGAMGHGGLLWRRPPVLCADLLVECVGYKAHSLQRRAISTEPATDLLLSSLLVLEFAFELGICPAARRRHGMVRKCCCVIPYGISHLLQDFHPIRQPSVQGLHSSLERRRDGQTKERVI